MTRKLASIDDFSMGDLSSIIGRGPVADLSWLAVDEKKYREDSVAPHQNLDIIPELSKALSEGQEGVPERLPYKDINLTNVNPLTNPVHVYADKEELIRKTAFYVYRGLNDGDVNSRLASEFGHLSVERYRDQIASVLKERGLLGNVYIDSDHFPKCVDSKVTKEFVKRYASKSLYVIQKDKCQGCVKNIKGRCASLGRTLVDSVNYDSELLNRYVPELKQTGRLASVEGDVKATLAASFLNPESKPNRETGVSLWTQQKIERPAVTEADINAYVKKASESRPEVSLELLAAAKKVILGKTDPEYLRISSDPEIRKLADYGKLLGSYIFDMDALGGCAKTSSHLKEKGIKGGLYLVRRASKCAYCQCAKGGQCESLSRSFKIVSSYPDITVEDYERVVLDKVASNKLTREEGLEAIRRFAGCGDETRLRVISKTASLTQPLTERRDYGYKTETAFTGNFTPVEEYDPEEITTFLSTKMNEGVFGSDLQRVASSRYTQNQIAAFIKDNAAFMENDGIQGFYHLDPTVYRDFGRGCKVGSSKYRGRGAAHVKKASACDTCVKQTSPGWCSAYAKPLIASVNPEEAKSHSRKVSLPVYVASHEPDISDVYELHQEMIVDLGKPRRNWDPTL